MPRYVVERTFPDGLPISGAEAAEICLAIVERNAHDGVTWVHSYVSDDRHKTFCVYDAPSPEAMRKRLSATSCRSTASRRSACSIRISTADGCVRHPRAPVRAAGARGGDPVPPRVSARSGSCGGRRSQEAPQLLFDGASVPRRLLLEGAERSQFTLSVHHLFDGDGTEGTDQLVLEVCAAHIETESLHVFAGEVGTEACPLETALEVTFLSRIAQSRQCEIETARAETIQEAADCLRTPNWHDRDAFTMELSTAAFGQRFEGGLVAHPFDSTIARVSDRASWSCAGNIRRTPSNQGVSMTTIFALAPLACRSHASAIRSCGYVSMSKTISPAAACPTRRRYCSRKRVPRGPRNRCSRTARPSCRESPPRPRSLRRLRTGRPARGASPARRLGSRRPPARPRACRRCASGRGRRRRP